VALTATIYTFDIDLSDTDRGCYESLALRVAKHPSESEEYLATRVLAYCLEFTTGLAFSSGVSDPDEPTLSARDMTGAITAWIEIGLPDAARLHKASKAARRVAVYTHKDPSQWLRQIEGERIHRADTIECYAIQRSCIDALVGVLERRMVMTVSVADRHLLVATGEVVIEGDITRVPLP
jgi:uncharacterized protein YaeQ